MKRRVNKNREFLKKSARDVNPRLVGQVFSKMLMKTINQRDGALGFAANQLSMRDSAFTALIGGKWQFFANPEIIEISKQTQEIEEGCLSIPNKEYKVNRHKWIKLKWLDTKGEHTALFDGMDAIVIQHEVDHLRGILIDDIGEQC